MRRAASVSLVCAVLFLLAVVPSPASAATAPRWGVTSSLETPHAAPTVDATRPASLPSGWTYWNQTIYWQNYSLRYYPGTRHFFPGVNMFDSLVVSNQFPGGQMTAFYVNASGQLLSYNLQTGVYRTLGAWPTNLSSYDTPAIVQGFQSWNGTLTTLYEMGSDSHGYVDVEWYNLGNGTFRWANTTIDEGTSSLNVNLGVINSTGWVYYTNNAESTIDLYNVYSDTLVTASAGALSGWNSGVYVAGADQVVEDVDSTSNNTLEVRAFNATFSSGSSPTIQTVTRWGGTISGGDFENMPYMFNVSGANTTLWGLGGGGDPNRNMVMSLQKDMARDGNPSTADTGVLGTTDPSAYAFWDQSHYFFNGYDPRVGTGDQGPYIDPVNDSGIFASGGSNASWFNRFLSSYNFGFGGGPWVNSWQFIGPSSGWENAIMENGTSSGVSCGTVCSLMVYWLPGHTTEFLNSGPAPPTLVHGTALNSTAILWNWSQSTSPGIVNDSGFLYSGPTCSVRLAAFSGQGPITFYTASRLRGGTTYSLNVAAWNASGPSAFSNCASVTTPSGAPAEPTGLSVTAATLTTLTWSWTNPTPAPTFDNISLALGPSPIAFANSTSEGPVATATVTGLASGTQYFAEVTAWNGTTPGPASAVASGSTLFVAPSPPSALHQTANTSTSLQLAWTDPPPGSFTNLTLYYHLRGVETDTMISLGTASAATLTGLAPGTQYDISLAAWNHSARSSMSTDLLAWTTNPAPPVAPIGLRVTSVTNTSVSLTWSLPAAGFDNVSLEYHIAGPGAKNRTLSLGGPISAFAVGLLAPGSTYWFSVATWNLTTSSGYVPFVNGTTAPNSTSTGSGSGCGLSCDPWLLISGGALLGVLLGLVGAVVTVRRRRRDPPS